MGGAGTVSSFAGVGNDGRSIAIAGTERPFGVCFDASAGGSLICSDQQSVLRIKNGE